MGLFDDHRIDELIKRADAQDKRIRDLEQDIGDLVSALLGVFEAAITKMPHKPLMRRDMN